MKGYLAALFLLLAPAASAGAGQLLTYGPPPAPLFYAQHNNDYTVRVRLPGGEWQSLFAYRIRVDGHHPQDASLVYFDFDGPVEVEVEKNNGAFSRVSLLPALPGVTLKTEGQVVRFTLARPERSKSSTMRCAPMRQAAIAPSISPCRPSGSRVLRKMIL